MMKLPNGYGTVSKLSGKRRRPFMVREGKSGHQKIIDYATTKEEGLLILANYNKDELTEVKKAMTFQDLFDFFLEKRENQLGKATVHSLKSSLKFCTSLIDMDYHHIKAFDMQECINHCGRGYSTQNAIKNLFYHLDRFALELDICKHNFSAILTTMPAPDTTKTIFSDEERDDLWKSKKLPWVDSVLIFLYTGLRISELLEMKKEQVDLVAGTLTGGKKTKAGKNRVIPIHSKILPLIQRRMECDGEFLISHNGKRTTESNYRKVWKKLMSNFKMAHTPHECRHTFRSLLDSAGANKVCIDRMMGHKSKDTGERVYTHKTTDELRRNLELVTS